MDYVPGSDPGEVVVDSGSGVDSGEGGGEGFEEDTRGGGSVLFWYPYVVAEDMESGEAHAVRRGSVRGPGRGEDAFEVGDHLRGDGEGLAVVVEGKTRVGGAPEAESVSSWAVGAEDGGG